MARDAWSIRELDGYSREGQQADPQLEDLYIKEAHRGAGQGKRLFGELGAVAKERGCSRMEWRVLKVSSGTIDSRQIYLMRQWNKPSIDFYVECLKAENLVEWDTMRIEGQEGLDRLVSFKQ
jgi:GNAT superfamily N-acetyltransferase